MGPMMGDTLSEALLGGFDRSVSPPSESICHRSPQEREEVWEGGGVWRRRGSKILKQIVEVVALSVFQVVERTQEHRHSGGHSCSQQRQSPFRREGASVVQKPLSSRVVDVLVITQRTFLSCNTDGCSKCKLCR